MYRLALDGGASAIAYVWHDSENYWVHNGAGGPARHDPAGSANAPERRGPAAAEGAATATATGTNPTTDTNAAGSDSQSAAAAAAAAAAADHADPFSPANGLELFEAANRRLTALDIRTPRLYWIGRTAAQDSAATALAHIAIVEDLPGGNLEAVLDRDPEGRRARRALERLAELLTAMREDVYADASGRPGGFGELARLDAGGSSRGESCERVVLDRALEDLAEGSQRDPRLAASRARLEDALRACAEAVAPRTHHVLVHGELGPDHVLLAEDDEPALIDIEGLMYFDVEGEHAFLRVRFRPEHLRFPDVDGLDEARLRLYKLAKHLSLVAGPLRLLDGDFPDRAFMAGIAEHHLHQALACAAPPPRG